VVFAGATLPTRGEKSVSHIIESLFPQIKHVRTTQFALVTAELFIPLLLRIITIVTRSEISGH
jgi:hypothetical protein